MEPQPSWDILRSSKYCKISQHSLLGVTHSKAWEDSKINRFRTLRISIDYAAALKRRPGPKGRRSSRYWCNTRCFLHSTRSKTEWAAASTSWRNEQIVSMRTIIHSTSFTRIYGLQTSEEEKGEPTYARSFISRGRSLSQNDSIGSRTAVSSGV